MTAPPIPRQVFGRGWFVALAAASAAFTVYGSYVPFEWRSRPWSEVTAAFEYAVRTRLVPDSRSDFAANCALGVPLGFALLGALRVDRRGRGRTLLAGGAVVAACTAFAAAVEFGQLYTRERTCSGSDIWAQGLGAALGAAAWIGLGQPLTDRLRRSLDAAKGDGNTAPLLLLYGAVLLVAQALPLDLTASPREVYQRVRDPMRVTWVPLGELVGPERTKAVAAGEEWKKVGNWLELFAIYLPAGVLAAGLPGRFRTADGLFHAAGLGLAFGVVLEGVQLLVVSRHPSTTDVLVGAVGFTVGWIAARCLSDRGVRKRRGEVAVVLGQLWAAVLAVIAWQPFDFYPALLGTRVAAVNWLPFNDQIAHSYLWALNEIMTKALAFVPLGAIAAWGVGRGNVRRAVSVAAGVCGLTAAVLEVGQLLVPSRYGSPTDVLLGVGGGVLGGWVTARVIARSKRAESALAVG